MLDILARSYEQARQSPVESDAERLAVIELLDLLEQGVADLEPESGLICAITCWSWGRAEELKARAKNVWKKQLGLLATKDPSFAFRYAASQIENSPNTKPLVLKSIEAFMRETAERDLHLASTYASALCAQASDKDALSLGEKMKADIQEKIAQKIRTETLLQELFASRAETTADMLEKRMRQIVDCTRYIEKESMNDYLSAGLWANLFDQYVVTDRESAIRLGFEMGQTAPPGRPIAKQIAASLLAAQNPQRTPFLRPLRPDGLPVPLHSTRIQEVPQ